MDRWDDDPDRAEIDPLTDLVGLWTASDPEELWRALVVYSDRSTTDHWLAVELFRRRHDDGTPGALTTALLLCTDHRWERCTTRLIAGVAETSLLSEDDLDELAAPFLWSDRFLFEYPVSWIGTEWVSIDVTGGRGAWDGDDDGDRASGRGWAVLEQDGSLRGHIYFHLGDDSGFCAVPAKEP